VERVIASLPATAAVLSELELSANEAVELHAAKRAAAIVRRPSPRLITPAFPQAARICSFDRISAAKGPLDPATGDA
jgi:hypothetical protein